MGGGLLGAGADHLRGARHPAARGTRPAGRGCGAEVAADAVRPGDLLFFRGRRGQRDHPRRLRRRSATRWCTRPSRAAGRCASRGCPAPARHRSASDSWRCGAWSTDEAQAGPLRHRRHHPPHRRRRAPGHPRRADRGSGRGRRAGAGPVRREDRSADRRRAARGRRAGREPRESARVRALCERYVGHLAARAGAPRVETTLMPGISSCSTGSRSTRRWSSDSSPATSPTAPRSSSGRAGSIPSRFRVGAYGSDAAHRPELPPIAARRAAPSSAASRPAPKSSSSVTPRRTSPAGRASTRARSAVATGSYSVADLAACAPHAVFENLSADGSRVSKPFSPDMHNEVELKAVLSDPGTARMRLLSVGAIVRFRGAMSDRRYDRNGELAARDEVLRLRTFRDADGPSSAVIGWKGPTRRSPEGYKERDEIELGVGEAHGAPAAFLAALGYEVDARHRPLGGGLRPRRRGRAAGELPADGSIWSRWRGDPPAIERAVAVLGIPRAELHRGAADRIRAPLRAPHRRAGSARLVRRGARSGLGDAVIEVPELGPRWGASASPHRGAGRSSRRPAGRHPACAWLPESSSWPGRAAPSPPRVTPPERPARSAGSPC